ncbi:hypothetical protein I6M90_21405 [Acinetobacter bereziniae]|uniref:hypothetical protein n=1 Tax=Acinetobacter bereziniae TaxID=106648 RepID=UPI0019022181|nr:hypothetical protein [Acinetobacter bereziniae]MBJ8454300.1 hypothetical protein [Acinetobacter bereziniae]MBJ8458601.1 hypothetical protein [Acinetobacter bereziniae]
MNKTDFEKFLKDNVVAKKEEVEIDWDKQRQEWLDFVDFFYAQIEDWLGDYKNQGLVEYSYTEKNITEDHIGSYYVRKMDLTLAGQRLTFDPVGTLLIGTKGRIDLTGPRGTIKFLLADKLSKGVEFKFKTTIITGNGSEQSIESDKPVEKKAPEWIWKILERHTSRISYAEFTQENFFEALMELVNG